MKITSDWNDINSLTNGTTKSITISIVHWSRIMQNSFYSFIYHGNIRNACRLNNCDDACSTHWKKVQRIVKNHSSDVCGIDRSLISDICFFRSWNNTSFSDSIRHMIIVNSSICLWILCQKRFSLNRHYKKIDASCVFFYSFKINMQKIILPGEYCRPYLNKEDATKKELIENIHHILARSRWWSNDEANKLKAFEHVHNAFHRFFGNGTMQEQLFQLLWRNWKALTQEFKNDLLKILQEDDQRYYYKEQVFKK